MVEQNTTYRHGTVYGYREKRCRCPDCLERGQHYRAQMAQRRREVRCGLREVRTQAPFVHGTNSGYSRHRCRCDLCRGWKREDARRYRARLRGSETVEAIEEIEVFAEERPSVKHFDRRQRYHCQFSKREDYEQARREAAALLKRGLVNRAERVLQNIDGRWPRPTA